ncbi:excinuclease ABC subunit UvrC [bacterium]|nr:excinuclease ABC subunit UvrC [bacterium]
MIEITDEFLATLPTSPGVYLMKDKADKIIYVGKALNLRSRVRSYFREAGDERFTVPFIRRRVASIETILTDSEKEALLLENTLIKRHKPRYNVKLRDDKTYISLRLDVAHKWPRLHRARKRKRGDKALYFGPYSSSKSVNETIRFLQRLFPIRSCSDRELEGRVRPCILHQIDRCSAPCVGLVTPEQYEKYVEKTLLFLRGQKKEVVDLLNEKMAEYSEELLFEKAAMVRDKLRALELTAEEEKVHSHRTFEQDVIAMCRRGGKIAAAVLHFRRGKLVDVRTYHFPDHDLEDAEVMEDFLSRFYEPPRVVPSAILVSAMPMNEDLLRPMLEEQREGPVEIRQPQRGEKRRMMEMAAQNAEAALERALTGQKTMEETLANLQSALHLEKSPRLIQCFDISNLQGSFPVGSMVTFRDTEPEKSRYKRFRIKTVEGQNDFAMMDEVLRRQYGRLKREEGEFPDLVIIDGGIGQLNVAREVFADLGLTKDVPVVGLAKARLKSRDGEQVRTEERIFLPGRKNPVTFRRADPALHLIERIRDETHRFAVTYHRLLRSRRALRTGLEDIPGVGPKRRGLLLKRFGSLAKIRAASVEELAGVDGIPPPIAEAVYLFLHPEDSGD